VQTKANNHSQLINVMPKCRIRKTSKQRNNNKPINKV